MVLAMLESAHSLPEHFRAPPRQVMAAEMIEVLLNGLHPR
jgi:hypothetical protein